MLHDVLVMSPSPPGRGFYDAVDHFHASTPGLYALVLNGTRFDDHAAAAFARRVKAPPNFDARSFDSRRCVSPPGRASTTGCPSLFRRARREAELRLP